MGIDYYKLYLRKFCGSYDDAKICETEEKLLKLIDINYNNYAGCLIIARDKQNDQDIIIGSRSFENAKVKEEKKQVERKEDILDTKVPMSRFSKLKREEKRKSNYIPLLILSAISLLIICSVGYIIIRHLSNQPQVIKPNTISTANHLSIASGAKSSRSISEVTVSGANVTTTTQGNQLMVDLSNVKSSVVLEVELSENSNDTWFSVDNSDTSESYYLSKTNKSKYSLDLSDKIKTTQIIIAQPSKVTLKINGESLDLSQLDQNTPSYLTLRIQ